MYNLNCLEASIKQAPRIKLNSLTWHIKQAPVSMSYHSTQWVSQTSNTALFLVPSLYIFLFCISLIYVIALCQKHSFDLSSYIKFNLLQNWPLLPQHCPELSKQAEMKGTSVLRENPLNISVITCIWCYDKYCW